MGLFRKVKEGSHREIYMGGLKILSYKQQSFKEWMMELYVFLCSKLPIQRSKILCWSYAGSTYSCNPRYLSEYLLKHYPEQFQIVWMFENADSIPAKLPSQIRAVTLHSIRWCYDIATAGAVVCNGRIPQQYGFRRREEQLYIQTWHGPVALKKIEGDTEATLPPGYVQMAKEDSAQATHFISGNAMMSEIYRRAFWYNGPILECGSPRIDYLLESASNRTELCDRTGLNPDCRYLLYAPTFRKDMGLEAYQLDMERVVAALSQRFGGEWKVLFRLHPNVRRRVGELNLPACCMDVTMHQDMQELLVISEILLTDYSSTMFEMAYCRKMALLFAPDIEEYIATDRELYFDIFKLPFPLAQRNDELEELILQFNEEEYQANIQAFMETIGSFEHGVASKTIAETLFAVEN